jgi:hypothetical protein
MQCSIKWMRHALSILLLLPLTAAGCSETGAERAQRLDPLLTQAGFRVSPADTEDRREAMSSLTPLKVQYFEYKGKPRFWVADPYVCHCVYTGDETDYDRLHQLKRERAEFLDEETAQQKYLEFMTSPVNQVFLGD